MNINLLDIDNLIQDFIKNYNKGLSCIHNNYIKGDNLSFNAFVQELMDELKTGCITFVNNNSDLDGLGSYLFYIANSFAKKHKSENIFSQTW